MFRTHTFDQAVLLVALAGTAMLVLPGCGTGLGRTYTVKGKVAYKGAGDVSQLAGGTIEFRPVADPTILATGEIVEDGSFTLRTVSRDGRKTVDGVVGGEHEVRLEPLFRDEARSRVLLDQRFWAFETSGLKITVPSAGEIRVEVTRGKPGAKFKAIE